MRTEIQGGCKLRDQMTGIVAVLFTPQPQLNPTMPAQMSMIISVLMCMLTGLQSLSLRNPMMPCQAALTLPRSPTTRLTKKWCTGCGKKASTSQTGFSMSQYLMGISTVIQTVSTLEMYLLSVATTTIGGQLLTVGRTVQVVGVTTLGQWAAGTGPPRTS